MGDWSSSFLALAAAIVFGFVLRTIVHRRMAAAADLARAEERALRAGLEERVKLREEQLEQTKTALGESERRRERLESESAELGARAAALEAAEKKLPETFRSLASSALAANNQTFLDLAKQNLATLQSEAAGDLAQRQQAIAALVDPLAKGLDKVEGHVRELEKAREHAYGTLKEQVGQLLGAQQNLARETRQLSTALRRPEVRGSWGEMQLKRAVELAGLVDHVDFHEQVTTRGDETSIRPDVVVHLPGGKEVVVDAKVPLDAYLRAIETDDPESRRLFLVQHAKQLRDHLARLAAKEYWKQFATAPDFVVLFLPNEAMFVAALEQDPALIEDAFRQNVLIVMPATLVALLKTVAYGWRQEKMAENARAISETARVLHERLQKFADHLSRVGKGLGDAVKSYNAAVGSYETRVLPQTRRFEELGTADSTPSAVQQVDTAVRALASDSESDGDDPPLPTA